MDSNQDSAAIGRLWPPQFSGLGYQSCFASCLSRPARGVATVLVSPARGTDREICPVAQSSRRRQWRFQLLSKHVWCQGVLSDPAPQEGRLKELRNRWIGGVAEACRVNANRTVNLKREQNGGDGGLLCNAETLLARHPWAVKNAYLAVATHRSKVNGGALLFLSCQFDDDPACRIIATVLPSDRLATACNSAFGATSGASSSPPCQ